MLAAPQRSGSSFGSGSGVVTATAVVSGSGMATIGGSVDSAAGGTRTSTAMATDGAAVEVAQGSIGVCVVVVVRSAVRHGSCGINTTSVNGTSTVVL